MTLLILAQPGAIIDIYRERLIVAVICLNYSGDQEKGARLHARHQGSCYMQTASQMDYTPRPSPLYSKVGKLHGTLWLAGIVAAHSRHAELANLPSGYEYEWCQLWVLMALNQPSHPGGYHDVQKLKYIYDAGIESLFFYFL